MNILNCKHNYCYSKFLFTYLLRRLCIGLLLWLWLGNHHLAMSHTPKRRALLVGISKYQSVASLKWSHRDVELWRGKLSKLGFEIKTLTDEQATLDAIKQELEALKHKSQPQDITIFVYSGHGTVIADPSTKDGCRTALAPYDTKMTGPPQASYPAPESVISDQWLAQWLTGFKTNQVMVVLDSCFSGGLTERAKGSRGKKGVRARFIPSNVSCSLKQIAEDAQPLVNIAKQTPFMILTASHSRQLSYESDRLRSGIFTQLLLQTMKHIPCKFAQLSKMLEQNVSKNAIYRQFIPIKMQPRILGDINRQIFLWSDHPKCSYNSIKLSFRDPKNTLTMTKYKAGQLIQISVIVQKPTWLALCSRSTEGEINQFFPNEYHPSYRLRPRITHKFPPSIERYTIEAYGPPGAVLFWVIADAQKQPKCGEPPVPPAIKNARGGFKLTPGIRQYKPTPTSAPLIVWDWIEVIN